MTTYVNLIVMAASLILGLAPIMAPAENFLPMERIVLEPEQGFPADFVAETGDLRLAMTPAEVSGILRQKYTNIEDVKIRGRSSLNTGDAARTGYEFLRDDFNIRFANDRGFDITFDAFQAVEAVVKTKDVLQEDGQIQRMNAGESLSVVYGTPITGNRVQIIRRAVKYDEPVAVDVLREAIVAKYGKPHGVGGDAQQTHLYYGFIYGEPLETRGNSGPGSKIVTCTNPAMNLKSITLSERYAPISLNGVRSYLSNNNGGRESLKSCDAGIHIAIVKAPNPKAAEGIIIFITDNLAISEDLAELTALVQGMERDFKEEPAGTTKVPDL